MKLFLKEATLSISNIKEKDVNMSSNSKEIISVTTESNYDGQVTDIDDGNEQGVIQITIEEPVLCYRINLVKITTQQQYSLSVY